MISKISKTWLMFGLIATSLVTVVISSAASAEYFVPDADTISHLVQENCGSYLQAENDVTDNAKSDYAHCVFSTFTAHNLFEDLFESCGLTRFDSIDLQRIPHPDAVGDSIECVARLVDQQEITTQLGALGEACELYRSESHYLTGCNVKGYCEECPMIPIPSLIGLVCTITHSLCQEDLIQVEHIETHLKGECLGEMTIYDEFPPPKEIEELNFGRSSGIVEYFFWKVNTTLQPENNLDFDFVCRGEAKITGGGTGGFYRQVIFRSTVIEAGGTICNYDGFNQTSCRGSIGSDHEVFGYPGRFHVDVGNSEYLPPESMIFEHDSGWVLRNLHQGSLRVYQGMDPEPAEIPQKILDVPVKYNVTDTRSHEKALPYISTGVAPFLVTILLVVLRQKQKSR